ncbi:MAG: alpha-ketoglutarate-dependent dioxygenase AlkB [Fluviicola sp.]|nr:MAG: alpha-ketoglutarate-dependent dioxygenase AlkB [Fluviicola sp.]
MIKQDIENGWYIWEPNFYSPKESKSLFQILYDELPWEGGEINLFGKTYQIPRKQVMFADNGLNYGYSGKKLNVINWNAVVKDIKNQIELESNYDFNACLANLYRDGDDSNGWHSDNEKELGKNPIIGSISLGATRVFKLKHLKTNTRLEFELTSGSLLIMGGEMQHFWKHQIPKTKSSVEPRINLTFRKLIK